MHRKKTMCLGVAMLLAAEVGHAAGRKTSTDIAELFVPGGVVLFRIEQAEGAKKAILYVRDRDVIDSVYMQPSAAELRALAKACEETAVELEKGRGPDANANANANEVEA